MVSAKTPTQPLPVSEGLNQIRQDWDSVEVPGGGVFPVARFDAGDHVAAWHRVVVQDDARLDLVEYCLAVLARLTNEPFLNLLLKRESDWLAFPFQ